MPALQAALVPFAAKGIGAGTQTVPGFVDRDGAGFLPKVVLFQSCFAAINTLTQGGIPIGGYSDFRGIDTGAIRSALTATDAYSGFGFKAADTGVSFGDHSIMDVWTDNFGQAQIYRAAKISAKRVGEIDIQYDGNLRTGDVIFALGLAGDDLNFTFTNDINGTYATPSIPRGMLTLPMLQPAASGATTWGTGGQNVNWGFATRDGQYGAQNLYVVNQGSNFSAALADRWACALDGSGVLSPTAPTISAWGSNSFTIANGGLGVGIPMMFSGELIRCAGGTLLEPAVAGQQIFDTGIDPIAIWFFGIGQIPGTGVYGPIGQQSLGWATKVGSRGNHWSGEKTPGNVPPQYGARYLANNSVMRFGTPNAGSTTFNSVADITGMDTAGPVTLDWSAVSGLQYRWQWFAIGLEASSPPPPPPSSNPICPVPLPLPVLVR